ncbi:MAG: hypothetical protein N5P05_003520 [Chroococcopsis gigantea SAG 12.99]|jgi:hypothetical protein|nr:hypothetical protein [Chlorogloea purpurea SAG 13.99]MDV3001914.1 hypothetical protein [Chroococcopsis gigantea SAG 12.99]
MKVSGIWWRWAGGTIVAFWLSLLWVEVGDRAELKPLDAIIGAGIMSVTQALVIYPHCKRIGAWILFTVGGWWILTLVGGGALGWFIPNTGAWHLRCLWGEIFGIAGGFWLGLCQSIALRLPFAVSRIWVGINALSWSVGLALGWSAGAILKSMTGLYISEVIGLSLTWLVVGVSTGFVWGQWLNFSVKA